MALSQLAVFGCPPRTSALEEKLLLAAHASRPCGLRPAQADRGARVRERQESDWLPPNTLARQEKRHGASAREGGTRECVTLNLPTARALAHPHGVSAPRPSAYPLTRQIPLMAAPAFTMNPDMHRAFHWLTGVRMEAGRTEIGRRQAGNKNPQSPLTPPYHRPLMEGACAPTSSRAAIGQRRKSRLLASATTAA